MEKRLSFICLATLLLIGCTPKAEIPAILQNHPLRTTFTKLDDPTNKPEVLFNGKDLTNFYVFTAKNGKDSPLDTNYVVQDGVLFFSGPDPGYIATNKSYSNYYLKAQVKWGNERYGNRKESPRDSGIIFHFNADRVWPTSFEFQVQEGDMGDSWLTGNVTCTDSQGTAYPVGRNNRIVKYADAESPYGEWSLLEMIVWDDNAEFYVNGVKVNDIHNLSLTEGKILFQLEFADVYYKDIEILPLKENNKEMKKMISTEKAPAAIGPYSQAIEANGFVYASGQLPIDPTTGQFPEGGIKEQTRQSILNARAILDAAGLSLANVVKTTVFLADMNDFAAMNEVYASFFQAPYPARSAVAVKTLPKGALVEIECVAVK